LVELVVIEAVPINKLISLGQLIIELAQRWLGMIGVRLPETVELV